MEKTRQISVNKNTVDWGGICGNLTFGVGVFGVESGMIKTIPSQTTDLILHNENTNSTIEQSLYITQDGSPQYEGDFTVYGVPGTGSSIRSRFIDPSGSVTNKLFPTGSASEIISVDSHLSESVSKAKLDFKIINKMPSFKIDIY